MRKLKLQMQVTVDGFVAGPNGELDWMAPDATEADYGAFVDDLADTSDTILLGRKMTPGFISYWESVNVDSPEYAFAQKMVRTSKVAFSRTLDRLEGRNLRVERGDVVERVNHLKRLDGGDIIVYGGATFVASLIEHDLIDELHFFVNPVAIGEGLRIFKDRKPLKLRACTTYTNGVVVTSYSAR